MTVAAYECGLAQHLFMTNSRLADCSRVALPDASSALTSAVHSDPSITSERTAASLIVGSLAAVKKVILYFVASRSRRCAKASPFSPAPSSAL